MPPRTRCRICQESTSIGDGYCEFCGNALELEAGVAALSARAERLAAAGPPVGPGITPAEEESEGQKSARFAFTLALAGVFCLPILAPIAFVLGRQAARRLRAEERASWMAGGAMVVGGVWTFLVVFSISVTTYVFWTAPDRLDAALRAQDERVRELEERVREISPASP